MSNPLVTPAVVTVYGADGTKQRKVVGLAGGTCHKATLPYEAREIQGQMKKTPTGDAYLGDGEGVKVEESVKMGG